MSRMLASLTLCLLTLLVACDSDSGSRDGSLLGPGLDPDGFETASLAAFSFEDAVMAIDEATLDRPTDFAGDLVGGESRGHGPDPGGLLRALDLTRDQRLAILRAVFDSRTCIRGALELFRQINRDILEGANEQRREIRRAWQAGEISREEARSRLRALNEATRDAVRNNPDNEQVREVLCDCRQELFATIRQILDADQQQRWDDWVAGLDGECIRG